MMNNKSLNITPLDTVTAYFSNANIVIRFTQI